MLANLLRLAWRNIRRNPTYSIVTIAGLSLGICACISIYVIVHFEYSFDSFHPDGKRIYRVIGELTENTGEKDRYMVSPAALYHSRSSLTGIDAIAGVIPFPGSTAAGPTNAIITTNSYFDIFPYQWLAGDRHRALEQPFTIVLTQQKAQQYFGPRPPAAYLGKQVIYDDSLPMTVTGIIKDWDQPTDLPFTDFLSWPTAAASFLKTTYDPDGWTRPSMNTRIFMKLSPGTRPETIDAEMATLIRSHAGPNTRLRLSLQPIGAMHFDADLIENPIRTAHRPTLYGLMVIALAILMLAIVNFVNLSTAYSLQRTKEVVLRKILGSNRWRLILHFLSEYFMLILIATGVAIVLVNPTLAAFRTFLPPGIHFQPLSWPMAEFVLVLLIVTTALAGLYPARLASVARLRNRGAIKGDEKWLLRRGLIVLQFAISLVFIMGGILIACQLRYVQKKDLGFNADAIVRIGIPPGDSLAKVKTLQTVLRSVPGVSDVTRQWVSPMEENGRGMRLKFARKDVTELGVTQIDGDEHFIPLYGIRLIAGRNLFAADSVTEMVINETLARKMGYQRPDQALGKMLYWNDRPYPVVGIVADFHSRSLHDPITPVCIINRGEREFNLAIRLASTGQDAAMVKGTLERVGRVWRVMFPGGTWTYNFYDDTLALLYEKDRNTETLVDVAVALTIFISCIGLFGLTLFTVEKRAKEISIRKVLGASVANVLALLGKEVVGLTGIALLVATPVAWWLMTEWLHGFAYHVAIGPWIFLLAGAGITGMALMTISVLAIRAATANPIKNLRTE